MRTMIIFGVLLMLLGTAILAYQWLNHPVPSSMFNAGETFVR